MVQVQHLHKKFVHGHVSNIKEMSNEESSTRDCGIVGEYIDLQKCKTPLSNSLSETLKVIKENTRFVWNIKREFMVVTMQIILVHL